MRAYKIILDDGKKHKCLEVYFNSHLEAEVYALYKFEKRFKNCSVFLPKKDGTGKCLMEYVRR